MTTEKYRADANGIYVDGTLVAVVNSVRENGMKEDMALACRRAEAFASVSDLLDALKVAEKVLRSEGFEDDADDARAAIAMAQVTA